MFYMQDKKSGECLHGHPQITHFLMKIIHGKSTCSNLFKNLQFMGEHYFRMPTIQCLAKSLKKLISPLLCTCNLLPFGVVASTGNFFHGGGGQLSFIQGGSAWRFKPSPFNYMCINTNFYQNDTPFIYPEQNCTPFLYLKDKPAQ